jgi:DNA-binding SARP family transcriptional activator
MDFGLLGPLLVRDGLRRVAISAPRQRVLLAALLFSAGRVVSLDSLAETLWEGQPPAGARGALHTAVQRLRASLGPAGGSLIETQPPGYLITVPDGALDVRRFSVLAARGHAAAETGNWVQAAGLLREALGLWRGEPLADVPSPLLRDREVPAIEDQRLRALAARTDADLHLGRHAEMVAELRQLVAAHPLQEQFHAQLMLSLYRSGRPADALAAYQEVRRVLADELGLDPGQELQLLHQRILAADGGLRHPADGRPPSPAPAAAPASPPAPAPRDPAPGAVVPRQLPAGTRHFAGRDAALQKLTTLADEAAGASHTTVISVIDGTAGIGKTTLAVHFAHQVAGRFPDGQLYVNLRGFDPAGPPVTPAEAIRMFLDALALPSARVPPDLEAQSALYRSLLAGQRMLILLDNARDVDQVRPLLPASPGCLVIVTSRRQLTSLVAVEGAFPLTLDVLADSEAQELLARRLGPDRVAADPAAAEELARLCARLPLALSIAAARSASQPGLTLTALSAELRDTRGLLDALDAGHTATNVRSVLSWSYQQLEPATARLFRLLGLHPGPDVSAAAAASLAALPLPGARRGLDELTRANLLAEHAPGRFSAHDLLRAYAAELARAADSEAERHAATARMLDHYLHTGYEAAMKLHPARTPAALAPLQPGVVPEPIGDAAQALEWFESERRVMMAAAQRAADAGLDTHAWQIVWAMNRFLDARGRFHDEVAMERIALAAAQRLGDQQAAAGARSRLGYATGRLGHYEEAYTELEQAARTYTEIGDHAGQGWVHNGTAILLSLQGRQAEALGHAEQCLTCYTAAGHRNGQALALNIMGWMHAELGHPEEALGYSQQALELFRELGSQDGMAHALDALGYAHQQAGQYGDATACYQEAISLHHATGSRWGAAETLEHLGNAHRAAGNPAGARTAWTEALAILDTLAHPEAARIRDRLRELDVVPLT